MRTTDIPLAAYVHWPWCLAKCPYCDFNSHQVPAAGRDEAFLAYAEALVEDIRRQATEHDGRALVSVFLGGGTPSLFAPSAIAAVLSALDDGFGLATDAEITMEANPGAVERGDFADYRAAGVNRVSLGAQSFDGEALRRLGRLHGPDETVAAVAAARRAGFERLNLDLMHGLPGQTLATARADVAAALDLAVEHVSYYQLTLEPNTRFHAFPPELPPDDVAGEIAAAGAGLLAAAGRAAYEVSAYALPGAESRHNLNYWQFGDYLAFGAGAHGKSTRDGKVWRTARPAHPRGYIDEMGDPGSRVAWQRVDANSLPFEFMLNALRLTGGFRSAWFSARTGLPLAAVRGTLDALEQENLLEPRPDGWRPTALGQRFLNDLQQRFLPTC